MPSSYLAALDARDDPGEGAVLELGGEPELLRDGGAQVDVHPDDRGAVRRGELVRRVRRVGAEHDLAVGGHALRDLRGERVVLGRRWGSRRGGAGGRRGGRRAAAVTARTAPGEDGQRGTASAAGSVRGERHGDNLHESRRYARDAATHRRVRAHRCARLLRSRSGAHRGHARCTPGLHRVQRVDRNPARPEALARRAREHGGHPRCRSSRTWPRWPLPSRPPAATRASNPDKAAQYVDQAAAFVDKQTKGKYSARSAAWSARSRARPACRRTRGPRATRRTAGYGAQRATASRGGPDPLTNRAVDHPAARQHPAHQATVDPERTGDRPFPGSKDL